MSFAQIKRIKYVDNTPEQAIESYGSFVNLYEETKERVKKVKRKGWTPDRVLLCRASQSVNTIHEAIVLKFGIDTLYKAIDTHPFK